MKVDLLNREMVDSDLGVVNAARCSFDKESKLVHDDWHESLWCPNECKMKEHYELSKADQKLITYLAQHNHWTPFGHAQEVFEIVLEVREALYFFAHANLSGFEWLVDDAEYGVELKMRGSLYAWLRNLPYFISSVEEGIGAVLRTRYPISCHALSPNMRATKEAFTINSQVDFIDDEIVPITLRISCPIFVKRQLETHRRNFVMTDIEDFSQNEVSRRYVDSDPVFYTPKHWRAQSKDKKQGSDDSSSIEPYNIMMSDMDYNYITHASAIRYQAFNQRGIAHEQSRMLLPLSTYTTFWWTGSLKSWRRMFDLRLKEDVQSETRELAQMVYDTIMK